MARRLARGGRQSAGLATKSKTMLTPILMLLIMTLPYAVHRMLRGRRPGSDPRAAAAWGVGLLFLFTASGHFVQTDAMAQMLPPWVPARVPLVYATGVLEIAIGAALFTRRWRRLGAWAAALALVAFFPANVYAALNQVPMGGHSWGPVYLLVRAPLQLLILGWIWAFVLRDARGAKLA